MSITEICQKLNISNTTLKNYVDTFDDFFSDGAKERKRHFEQADLDTLASIAFLSSQGFNYEAIRRKLAEGYRDEFEGVTLGVDNRVIPVSTAQATIDAGKIRSELELVKQERDRLLDERTIDKQTITQLHEQIVQLNREIGRLEGELNYRRSQDEKEN